jgi:acetyl-CoA acetyltransferase
MRAMAAIDAGRFAEEILPVKVGAAAVKYGIYRIGYCNVVSDDRWR